MAAVLSGAVIHSAGRSAARSVPVVHPFDRR